MRDDCISSKRESKVLELMGGGAAARKSGRRKLNVFARWAISAGVNLEIAVSGVFLARESELSSAVDRLARRAVRKIELLAG
jgi:hypothetical protein